MPELPEVETTLRGIAPHIIGQKVTNVILRHLQLRWPIPQNLKQKLSGQTLQAIDRRGKYLLFLFANGTLILHLGMSGRLCLVSASTLSKKHDHVDIVFDKRCLRFTDPRRFGALLWTEQAYDQHPLLKGLGKEPLSSSFNGEYLFERAFKRKVAIKSFIMDSKVVTGVGNIYATESLFLAGIRPQKTAGKITQAQFKKLAAAIKKVLAQAIKKGGTTLRDFTQSDGQPGYFALKLKVYGRAKQPCLQCGTTLKGQRLGQRSAVYCPHCQR